MRYLPTVKLLCGITPPYNISAFVDNDIVIQGNTSFSKSDGESVYNLNVRGDHPIVKVIPKQLFATNGNHLYIGKEYDFFINTVDNATIGCKLSTVLVFKVF